MKAKSGLSRAAGVMVGIAIPAVALAAATVTSIDFQGTGPSSRIDIKSDAPLTYDKQDNAQDNQIVLELKGADLSKTASRKLDTSSFDSPVSLISPYQVKDQPDTARVVIQLRAPAQEEVTQDGNVVHIDIPNAAASGQPDAAPSESADASAQAPAPTESGAAPPPAAPDLSAIAPNPGQGAQGPAPEASPQTTIDEFSQAQQTQHFTGKPITLQVRDADIGDVFRLIGESSGFNILVGDDVHGKVTLSLVDVPWDQALDVLLKQESLGAERNNNILRITSLTKLTAEKQAEYQAKQASEQNAPRVTRVFPISYANLKDLTSILVRFGGGTISGTQATVVPSTPTPSSSGGPITVNPSSSTGSAGASGGSTGTGMIQADPRTNSIIVTDLPDKVERMKKLISILDTQTPQVLIEAKVVEAQETFSRSIGGKIGVGGEPGGLGVGNPQFVSALNGGNPLDTLIGTGGVYTTGAAAISGLKAGASTFGFSPNIATATGIAINAFLSVAETENEIKILSSPKLVVMNKETANVVQSTPVIIPTTTLVQGAGSTESYTVQQANLSLSVQPTVTNEGSVLMDLALERDIPFSNSAGQAVANRTLATKVLVASGSTLVIGGVYSATDQKSGDGFPWLRKIPILGWLFGDDSVSTDHDELFFFITPRILNAKEAGLNAAT